MSCPVSSYYMNTLMMLCRNNTDYIKKRGLCWCFHLGGGSSCCMHIRQHYDIYVVRCKAAGLEVHHWAMPRKLWKELMAAKEKEKFQPTLDGIFQKVSSPKEFSKDFLLDSVTRFIACNDQVSFVPSHECRILIPRPGARSYR